MVQGQIKFRRPKERIRVSTRNQGLRRDDKVLVRGNRSRHEALLDSLKILESDDLSGKPPAKPTDLRDELGSSSGDESDGSSFSEIKRKHMSKERYGVPKKTIKNRPRRRRGDTSGVAHTTTKEWNKMAPMSRRSPQRLQAKMRPPSVVGSDSGDDMSNSDSPFNESFSDEDSVGSASSAGSFSAMSSISSMMSKGSRVPLDDSMSIISGRSGGNSSKRKHKSKESEPKQMTPAEEEAERQDLLRRFNILRARGVQVKNFTQRSNLKDMKLEMGRLEYEKQAKQSIQLNRRWFLAGSAGVAKLTNKYGPNKLKGRWQGFDDYVLNSIGDYDNAFERMAEHYGGFVSTLTGGNPIWEIAVLFTWQFFMYGFLTDGAQTARANEELSSDDIRKRYPNLIQQAVQDELAVLRMNEEADLRRRQYELRNFDQVQTQHQPSSYYNPAAMRVQPMAPEPMRTNSAPISMAAPGMHFDPHNPHSRYGAAVPQAPGPPTLRPTPVAPPAIDLFDIAAAAAATEPHLNAENPHVIANPSMAHHDPTSAASINAHQAHHDSNSRYGTREPPARVVRQVPYRGDQENEDAYKFDAMFDALPTVETEEPVHSHYTQIEPIEYQEEGTGDVRTLAHDNLNLPQVTRTSTPRMAPAVPPAASNANENARKRTPFGKNNSVTIDIK